MAVKYTTDEVTEVFQLYLYPCMTILGTVGNLLCFLVMSRPNVTGSVTSILFRVLAVYDTLVLWIAFIRHSLPAISGTSVENSYDVACRIMVFCQFQIVSLARNILALVNIERVLVVMFPFHARTWVTKTRIYIAIIIQFIIISGYNGHLPWMFSLIPFNLSPPGTPANETWRYVRTFCNPNPRSKEAKFIINVWPWMDAAMSFFLPFIIILVSNIAIIYKLVKMRKERKSGILACNDSEEVKSKNRQTTGMLITISLVFLLTAIPHRIYNYIYNYLFNKRLFTREERSAHQLIQISLYFLLYLNHGINFFLYCISGKRFRDEFLQLVHLGGLCEKAEKTNQPKTSQTGLSLCVSTENMVNKGNLEPKQPLT